MLEWRLQRRLGGAWRVASVTRDERLDFPPPEAPHPRFPCLPVVDSPGSTVYVSHEMQVVKYEVRFSNLVSRTTLTPPKRIYITVFKTFVKTILIPQCWIKGVH